MINRFVAILLAFVCCSCQKDCPPVPPPVAKVVEVQSPTCDLNKLYLAAESDCSKQHGVLSTVLGSEDGRGKRLRCVNIHSECKEEVTNIPLKGLE